MSQSFTVIPNKSVLRDLRLREGKLQRDIEEAAKLPALRLSLYENGKPIPLEHLVALAKHYSVSPVSLTHPSSIESAQRLVVTLVETFELKLDPASA